MFKLLERRRSGCWIKGFFLGLLGYSDDNVLLAPSLNALQDMILSCQEFAAGHNLRFSTDPNPSKCKTKTLAFLKSKRSLPNLILCGNPLPWTDKCKHLGITITNKIDGCQTDIQIKNANYIEKNIELNQEFHFSHPETRLEINRIFNSHYYGSPLWDLFSPGARSIETSYNRSVKIMFGLPLATHRSLIEPLTGHQHVSKVLMRRFLGFMEKICKSKKEALKMLMETARDDVRSTTGSNYRNIMLLCGKTSPCQVEIEDVHRIQYVTNDEEDQWKAGVIKEIVNIKNGFKSVPGFDSEELDQVLEYLCTS